jgi:thioredoxin
MRKAAIALSIASLFLLHACNSKSEKNSSKLEGENKSEVKNESTIHITRDQFLSKVFNYTKDAENAKYLGDKPCIVDFYASWCGPCKVASPILEELAKEYEGKIYIYKVNTEDERQLSTEIGIQSIPTFLYFPMEGKPFSSMGIGKTPEETKKMFKEIIEKELLKLVK